MECPICLGPARFVAAPAFDGRRITCARCGTYDVSRIVLERRLLERIVDERKRRDVLHRARSTATERARPLITTYLL